MIEQKLNNVSNWVWMSKDKIVWIRLAYIWYHQDKYVIKAIFFTYEENHFWPFVQNFIADINTACRCMAYSNGIDHLSTPFYYVAKPIPWIYKQTKTNKHVFIMEAIIESPKGSDAIIGVEMTHMGQTVHKKILIISFFGN